MNRDQNHANRGEPFWDAPPFWEACARERQETREEQQLKSYYSRTAVALQRLVEKECDRMDYSGSMIYDEFPDRLMLEHACRGIARQYREEQQRNSGENGQSGLQTGRNEVDGKEAEKRWNEKETEELLDLIGVLFYHEMFRRRSRRRKYHSLWNYNVWI